MSVSAAPAATLAAIVRELLGERLCVHCRATAPGTGGSWLAAGCASISRSNAKIRTTNHDRSGRLGADSGLGGRPSKLDGSTSAHMRALIRTIRRSPDRYRCLTLIFHRAPIRLQQRLYRQDRKSTRLNSSHVKISYAVFCLKKK